MGEASAGAASDGEGAGAPAAEGAGRPGRPFGCPKAGIPKPAARRVPTGAGPRRVQGMPNRPRGGRGARPAARPCAAEPARRRSAAAAGRPCRPSTAPGLDARGLRTAAGKARRKARPCRGLDHGGQGGRHGGKRGAEGRPRIAGAEAAANAGRSQWERAGQGGRGPGAQAPQPQALTWRRGAGLQALARRGGAAAGGSAGARTCSTGRRGTRPAASRPFGGPSGCRLRCRRAR